MQVKETILVVDDEEQARNAVTRILKNSGYIVHALPGGQEAIDFAKREPFDLLLTDFRMPGMDGLTTVRAVRRINPQIVAIIMTANKSIDLAIQSLNLGVHGFVVKPFTIHELLTTISQTLERQQLIRENTKMKALVDIFAATEALIIAEGDAQPLPRVCVELACRETKSDEAFLFLLDGSSQDLGRLELAALALTDPEVPSHLICPEPEHYLRHHHAIIKPLKKIATQALEEGSTLFLIDDEEITLEKDRMIPAQKNACLLAVPMLVQGRPIGVLCVRRNNSEKTFSEVDLQTAAILAGQAAIAIENSRLVSRLARIEALREADRLRSEFVSTVSHELRTPLTSIQGYATTLLRDDVAWDGQTGHEYLAIISEECDKLMELIDNILEVSKIEAGALRIYPEPIQIREVIERAVKEAQRRLVGININLDVPPTEDLPFVLADHQRVLQVLRNLINNALKYSPTGLDLTIRLVQNYPNPNGNLPMVLISVSDKGVGLRSEDLGKVFERFYRVDTGPARRSEGTGLGLAICRGIVEAHKGAIWAESEGLGKGTTFCFTLPTVKLSSESSFD